MPTLFFEENVFGVVGGNAEKPGFNFRIGISKEVFDVFHRLDINILDNVPGLLPVCAQPVNE